MTKQTKTENSDLFTCNYEKRFFKFILPCPQDISLFYGHSTSKQKVRQMAQEITYCWTFPLWEFILSGHRFKYSWIYFSRPLAFSRTGEMRESGKPEKRILCINKIIGPFIICGRITKLIFLSSYGCGTQESCFILPVRSESVLSLNRI